MQSLIFFSFIELFENGIVSSWFCYRNTEEQGNLILSKAGGQILGEVSRTKNHAMYSQRDFGHDSDPSSGCSGDSEA